MKNVFSRIKWLTLTTMMSAVVMTCSATTRDWSGPGGGDIADDPGQNAKIPDCLSGVYFDGVCVQTNEVVGYVDVTAGDTNVLNVFLVDEDEYASVINGATDSLHPIAAAAASYRSSGQVIDNGGMISPPPPAQGGGTVIPVYDRYKFVIQIPLCYSSPYCWTRCYRIVCSQNQPVSSPILYYRNIWSSHPCRLCWPFVLGCPVPAFDSDHDGMPDVWELTCGHVVLQTFVALDCCRWLLGESPLGGLNPRVNDATRDFDGDGLINIDEFRYGTFPDVSDSDGDGLSDGDEVHVHHTDPRKRDTDGDGMPDGWEVVHGLNPHLNDATGDLDHDGFDNLKECQWDSDPQDPSSIPMACLIIAGSPSQLGQAVPSYGTYSNAPFQVLTNTTVTPTDPSNGMRYACCGWSGLGSIPRTGTGTTVAVKLETALSRLTWLWETNFLLTIGNADNGHTEPGTLWVKSGSGAQVVGIPANDYRFAGWSGGIDSTQRFDNPVTVMMNAPKTLTPEFVIPSCTAAIISGTVTYTGRCPGVITVLASTNGVTWTNAFSCIVSNSGPFSIGGLPTYTKYWVKAMVGMNPLASCTLQGNPLFLTNDVTGVTLTVQDIDSDQDGLPDWWERIYFPNVTSYNADSDPDRDGLSNGVEFRLGLNPMNCQDATDEFADADGDGYPNIYERLNGSDSTNKDSIPVPTIYVSKSGNDTNSGRTVTSAKFTIGAAVVACTNDYGIIQLESSDTPYPPAGNGNMFWNCLRPIMIKSVSGPSNCVVNCEYLAQGALMTGRHQVLWGVTISNAWQGIVCSGDIRVIDCRIVNNGNGIAPGGGVHFLGGAGQPMLRDCYIAGNKGSLAGGCYAEGTPTILHCLVESNSAAAADCSGGGIGVAAGANVIVSKSVIRGNQSPYVGGIQCSGQALIENCYIKSNNGGVCTYLGHVTIRNSTLLNNGPFEVKEISRDQLGYVGSDYWYFTVHFLATAMMIENTVLWNDSMPPIIEDNRWYTLDYYSRSPYYRKTEDTPLVPRVIASHCVVRGGYQGTAIFTNNPMLSVEGHIPYGSIAIDSGTSQNAPTNDIDGELRPFGGGTDIGADEFVDTDSDDLSDWEELNVYHTDPTDPDVDHDGLKDGDEVRIYHTDPHNRDTDNDGIIDGDEVHAGTAPLAVDSDGDGLVDGHGGVVSNSIYRILVGHDGVQWSNNTAFVAGEMDYGTSGTNCDTDGDGLVDGRDGIVRTNVYASSYPGRLWVDVNTNGFVDGEMDYGTSPTNSDTDGDGVPDGEEARNRSSPLDVDTDDDGLTDGHGGVVSNSVYQTLSGHDGVLWPQDSAFVAGELDYGTSCTNCDTDGDGLTDGRGGIVSNSVYKALYGHDGVLWVQNTTFVAGELDYGTSGTNCDTDGDGLVDGRDGMVLTNDYAVLFPDGFWVDANTNGYVDGEMDYNSSPTNFDMDRDGVPDGMEIHRGTSVTNVDTDGDGLVDGYGGIVSNSVYQALFGHDGVLWLQDPAFVAGELDYGTSGTNCDTDGDGLVDGRDGMVRTNDYAVLFAGRAWCDTNANGFVDGEMDHGTSPTNCDTDADGVNDGAEVRNGSFPRNVDSDADGLVDGWGHVVTTNRYAAAHPHVKWVPDSSWPGYVAGELQFGASPTNCDSDGDGLVDGRDGIIRASTYANLFPGRVWYDFNTNGYVDGEMDYGTSPMNPDTDEDGILDALEIKVGRDPLRWREDSPMQYDYDGDGLVDCPGHWIPWYIYPEGVDANRDGWIDAEGRYGTETAKSDTDGDGMPDGWEVAHGLDPLTDDAAADLDKDGISNLQEYRLGLDPESPDTDRDGLVDGDGGVVSNSFYKALLGHDGVPWPQDPAFVAGERDFATSATNIDTDADGLVDGRGGIVSNVVYFSLFGVAGVEDAIHPGTVAGEFDFGTCPTNRSTARNGIPDGWTVVHGLNPTNAAAATDDSDLDGLNNYQEYQAGTDPRCADTDGDGLSDSQERAMGTNPLEMDSDYDGLVDGSNGVVSATAYYAIYGFEGVADTNHPGYVCGEIDSGTDSRNDDSDGDGLPDGLEVELGTKPMSRDTDHDGLMDGEEVFIYGTDPTKADTDKDGMTDGWEVRYGMDPLVENPPHTIFSAAADPDGDGLSNTNECSLNSNPFSVDTDGDGLVDGSNGVVLVSSYTNGIPDGNTGFVLGELTWGTSPAYADTDGDGLVDHPQSRVSALNYSSPWMPTNLFRGALIGTNGFVATALTNPSCSTARAFLDSMVAFSNAQVAAGADLYSYPISVAVTSSSNDPVAVFMRDPDDEKSNSWILAASHVVGSGSSTGKVTCINGHLMEFALAYADQDQLLPGHPVSVTFFSPSHTDSYWSVYQDSTNVASEPMTQAVSWRYTSDTCASAPMWKIACVTPKLEMNVADGIIAVGCTNKLNFDVKPHGGILDDGRVTIKDISGVAGVISLISPPIGAELKSCGHQCGAAALHYSTTSNDVSVQLSYTNDLFPGCSWSTSVTMTVIGAELSSVSDFMAAAGTGQTSGDNKGVIIVNTHPAGVAGELSVTLEGAVHQYWSGDAYDLDWLVWLNETNRDYTTNLMVDVSGTTTVTVDSHDHIYVWRGLSCDWTVNRKVIHCETNIPVRFQATIGPSVSGYSTAGHISTTALTNYYPYMSDKTVGTIAVEYGLLSGDTAQKGDVTVTLNNTTRTASQTAGGRFTFDLSNNTFEQAESMFAEVAFKVGNVTSVASNRVACRNDIVISGGGEGESSYARIKVYAERTNGICNHCITSIPLDVECSSNATITGVSWNCQLGTLVTSGRSAVYHVPLVQGLDQISATITARIPNPTTNVPPTVERQFESHCWFYLDNIYVNIVQTKALVVAGSGSNVMFSLSADSTTNVDWSCSPSMASMLCATSAQFRVTDHTPQSYSIEVTNRANVSYYSKIGWILNPYQQHECDNADLYAVGASAPSSVVMALGETRDNTATLLPPEVRYAFPSWSIGAAILGTPVAVSAGPLAVHALQAGANDVKYVVSNGQVSCSATSRVTVLDANIEMFQPLSSNAVSSEKEETPGVWIMENVSSVSNNSAMNKDDAIVNGDDDTNHMARMVLRQVPGLRYEDGWRACLLVEPVGRVRLFRKLQSEHYPLMEVGNNGIVGQDLADELGTNDVELLVEGVAKGVVSASLYIWSEGGDKNAGAVDRSTITVTDFIPDDDTDGLCAICQACQACAQMDPQYVASVGCPRLTVKQGTSDPSRGIMVHAYHTSWKLPDVNQGLLANNTFSLDTRILDPNATPLRVLRPSGRIVSFVKTNASSAVFMPMEPDNNRTYKLVETNGMYRLIFASGYSHYYNKTSGALVQVQGPEGLVLTKNPSWPGLSASAATGGLKTPYGDSTVTLDNNGQYSGVTFESGGTPSLNRTSSCTYGPDGSMTISNTSDNIPSSVLKVDAAGNISRLINDSTSNGLWLAETRTETLLASNSISVETVVVDQQSSKTNRSTDVMQVTPYGRLVSSHVDGAGRTTRYEYSNGRVSRVIGPDGAWSRYEYDMEGRVTNEVTGLKDNPPDSDAAINRQTVYDYTPWLVGDSLDVVDHRPRTMIEYFAGNMVGKRLFWYKADGSEKQSIIVLEDGSHLTTVTRYVTGGSFQGFVASVTDPAGTVTTNTYATTAGGLITTTWILNDPLDERRVTVQDDRGLTISSKLLKNTDVLTETVNRYDGLGRVLSTSLPDGRASSNAYDCCGLAASWDADGVMTTYIHDKLGRTVLQMRAGVTNSMIDFDPAGSPWVTSVLADSLPPVTLRRSYDEAGRLVSDTDSRGAVTRQTYLESPAGIVTRTVYPDGGTRIDATYADGQPKSTYGSAVFPVTYDYTYSHGSSWPQGRATVEYRYPNADPRTFSPTNYTGTVLTNITVYDLAGRVKAVVRADGAVSRFGYDAAGRATTEVNEAGKTVLYGYDAAGRRTLTAVDMNNNGSADINSPDHISVVSNAYVSVGSSWLLETSTFIYTNSAGAEMQLLSRSLQSPVGTNAWSFDAQGLMTSRSVTYAGPIRTESVEYPDGTESTVVYSNGLAVASTPRYSSLPTLATYDALGRLAASTDPRTGTSAYGYDANNNLVFSVDTAGRTNRFTYDALNRRAEIIAADGGVVSNLYYTTGALKLEFGARTYPVAYEYDGLGRMIDLCTVRDPAMATFGDTPYVAHRPTFDHTRWVYDNAGRISAKIYADNTTNAYQYTADGLLTNRTDARGIVTSYNYNPAGGLLTVQYSDDTPGVTNAYNRVGLVTNVTDGLGSRKFEYTGALQLASETVPYSGGETDFVLSRSYDTVGRSSGLSVAGMASGTVPSYAVRYGYDAQGRFSALTNVLDARSSTFVYSYIPNTVLLDKLTMPNGIQVAYGFTNNLDRLESIVSRDATGRVVSGFAYTHNAVDQRIGITRYPATQKARYAYDRYGQLTNSVDNFADEAVSVRNRFSYDAIGNRLEASSGSASVLPRTIYTANAVNQYTAITNLTDGRTIGTADTPSYDQAGNLISYKGWKYGWDAENRLIVASNATTVVRNEYDYMSRRVVKTVYNNSTIMARQSSFLYDGWNLIAEIQSPASGAATTNLFTWGLDLSGSLQGAGGVGGLLSRTTQQPNNSTTVFYTFDGNGNVINLVGEDGTTVGAHYEYDPFGNCTLAKDDAAPDNPFRFSTKYFDTETGLLMYQLRAYSPALGRFISRDPAEEEGGVNLLACCRNNTVNYVDPLGLDSNGPSVGGGGLPFVQYDTHDYDPFRPARIKTGTALGDAMAVNHAAGFVVGITAEATGATVLMFLPEPSSKAGGVLLYADIADRIKKELTGEGYYEGSLKYWYGENAPGIQTSVAIKDWSMVPLMGAGGLPATVRTATCMELPQAVKAALQQIRSCNVDVTITKVELVPEVPAATTAGGAANSYQGAKLSEHLAQAEKYGAGGFKELENGRFRYYGDITEARNPGEMAGARVVREWNPETGAKRTWIETVDQEGHIRIVRPETGGEKIHYVFDAEGNHVGTR